LRPGVARRVDRFLAALERLDRLSAMSSSRLMAEDLLPLLEREVREVEVVIQGLLDLGSYIISAMGWEPPARYRDIGPTLARHGVLSSGDGRLLADLAGLRNIIVHPYGDVDYEALYEHMLMLRRDARRILAEMLDFLQHSGIDP